MIESFIKGIAALSKFLAPRRLKKITYNIKERTDFITVVLDDIYQIHNASAVLRSCDAFGILDVYVVENKNKFQPAKGISNSADKWLNIKKFSNYDECYKELKDNDYKICVTVPPSENSVFLDDFEIKEKIAIVIGSEVSGVSDFFKEKADMFLSIKMRGFVESLNLSVSTGIILYEFRKKLENSNIDWRLSPVKKSKTIYKWFKKTVYFSDKITEANL